MGEPKFVTGSTMRHVVVMTSTASIGLMALFMVDLADIYFLSLLGIIEVTAAIGYAGVILFFTASISIGLMIAMVALVSRSIGAKRKQRAKRYTVNIFIFSFIITSSTAVIIWSFIPEILTILGAKGPHNITINLAESYLRIIIPTMPIIGLGMCGGGILRALGDAKRSMYITLLAAVVNGILDPILIFGFEMGVEGAAWATVASRFTIMIYGFWVLIKVHNIIIPFKPSLFWPQIKEITKIASPAVLTNIATPIGAAYITFEMAKFGDSAVAGTTIITRLSYVAFGIVFALSGAVGPILGQNFGAQRFDRLKTTLKDALLFSGAVILVVSVIMLLSKDFIILGFKATGDAATLIALFCTYLSFSFFFTGTQFIANASFNNLGRPHYSTLFNFGRATIGTIPFAIYGAKLYGAPGILIGQAVGGVIFGILAYFVSIWHINSIKRNMAKVAP